MKFILFSILVLCLVNVSKQDDISQAKVETFVEIKETLCGCDAIIPVECTKKATENHFERLARSIESPITALWEKLNGPSAVKQDKPVKPVQTKPVCESDKLIRCNADQKIKVIKADLSNLNKNQCSSSNVTVDQEKNFCNSTRIKSTELAQKLCDDQNECKLSLNGNGFESVCECATQKYLQVAYMCVPVKSQDKPSRVKRQAGGFRAGQNGGRLGGQNGRGGLGGQNGRGGLGGQNGRGGLGGQSGRGGLGGQIGRGGRGGLGGGRGYGYGGYGGYVAAPAGISYGGYNMDGLDMYDYLMLSGFGVGFPRFGINQGFKFADAVPKP